MKPLIPFCPFMQSAYANPEMMRTNNMDFDSKNPLSDKEVESTDVSNTREDTSNNIEKDINIDLKKDITSVESSNQKLDSLELDNIDDLYRSPLTIEQILRQIQLNNPMIIRELVMSGIPYPTALRIVKRVIYLTLLYGR
jgi:hypothetical protein